MKLIFGLTLISLTTLMSVTAMGASCSGGNNCGEVSQITEPNKTQTHDVAKIDCPQTQAMVVQGDGTEIAGLPSPISGKGESVPPGSNPVEVRNNFRREKARKDAMIAMKIILDKSSQ